jgi:TetR/AcrR family transcriptional regulator, transcriptional repressor of bet genes
VLARAGFEGVTMRSVAAEAGWTRGIVEHYFADKDALVSYACRLAIERTLAETRLRHETLVGREALRGVLLDCLASQSQEVWFELLSLVGREPDLAAELVRFDAEITAVIAAIIAEMMARGEASPELDPEAEARAVFAFNMSLKVDARMQPGPQREQVVEAQVERFLDGLRRSPQGA